MCDGGGGLGFVGDLVSGLTGGLVDVRGSSKPKTVLSPTTYGNDQKGADEKAVKAREEAKKKAGQMLGRKSTILTGADGLTTQASTVKKTLLGS